MNDADKTAQIKAVFGIPDVAAEPKAVEAEVIDTNCKPDEPKAEQSSCPVTP